MVDCVPIGMGHKRDGNEDQVEGGGGEGDAFPGPVTVAHECGVEDDEGDGDGCPGGDAEKSQASADGDELSDEGEEIADGEVDHGEPSPEGAEALEDEFGVAAVGGGAEADSHFLNDDCHAEGEDDEGKEEADAEPGTSGGVGEHAGAVVLSEHNEDAGTDEEPEQTGFRGESAAGTSVEDADAVMGAVDIFVSNYDLFFDLDNDRFHRLR